MNDDIFTKERNFNLGINWTAVILFLVLVFVIYGAFFFFPKSTKYINDPYFGVMEVVAAEKDYLDERLDLLAKCESTNNPKAVNWNDAGSPSYGLYQFKEGTWKAYMRLYNVAGHAEDHELMNFIYDGETQRKLARAMLQDGLYYHWKACSTRYGWI